MTEGDEGFFGPLRDIARKGVSRFLRSRYTGAPDKLSQDLEAVVQDPEIQELGARIVEEELAGFTQELRQEAGPLVTDFAQQLNPEKTSLREAIRARLVPKDVKGLRKIVGSAGARILGFGARMSSIVGAGVANRFLNIQEDARIKVEDVQFALAGLIKPKTQPQTA